MPQLLSIGRLKSFFLVVDVDAAGSLSGSAASVSGYDVTVTATTNESLVAGVFGVKFGTNADANYTHFRNTPGAAASQSIVIGLLDGVLPGQYLSYIPYFNLTVTDPEVSRGYGTAGELFINEFDGLLLGQG